MMKSLLFIPGSNEKLISKGKESDADALIFDLEDAVSPDAKGEARILVRDALLNWASPDGETDENPKRKTSIVRINSLDTDYWEEDIDTVLAGHPDMIMLPKVSEPDAVITLVRYIEACEGQEIPAIFPIIETALGIENAYRIASSHERVKALLLGAEDLTADLHCKRTREGREIFYARSRIVACGRAAGVEIYDTPFTDTRDEEGIKMDAETARSLGFTGKAAITPRHIDVLNSTFSPTEEEIEYAKKVMEAIQQAKAEGRGVIALGSKMIDAPIVERARQVLEAAGEIDD